MSARTQNLGLVALALVGSLSLAYAMTGCKEMGSAHASSILDISDGRPLLALADGSAAVEAAPVAAPEQPADKLHDPIENPLGAYNDLKMAKRIGWGAAFLVGLIALCGLLARFGGKLFKPLGNPRVLLAIGSVGTFAATAYNAVALGGAWLAALSAAIPALIVAMIKVWQWEPAKDKA